MRNFLAFKVFIYIISIFNLFNQFFLGAGSLQGCNRCHFPGTSFCERVCYPGHRAYLPERHIYRSKARSARQGVLFKDDCNLVPPTDITWEEYVANSKQAEIEHKTINGCKNLSKINILPYAKNIARTTDAMHCFNNVISNLLSNLSSKENRSTNPNIIQKELEINKRRFETNWELSKDEKTKSDKRLSNIKGTIASSFPKKVWEEPWKLKSASKLHYATRYARASLIQCHENNAVMKNILNLFDIISMGCSDRFILKELNDNLLPTLYNLLSEREGLVPLPETTYTMHQLVHVFKDVKISGPPRYTWMFGFERANKYCKNLMHNQRAPINSMMKNYLWVETLTLFLIYRLENLNRMLDSVQNIDKEYIDKHIISFKDIYMEHDEQKDTYMIHSMESSRIIQLSGYASVYFLDDEDKQYLFISASMAANKTSLLYMLYEYWNALRLQQRKRVKVNDYYMWIQELETIPNEIDRKIRNKAILQSDWDIIKNRMPQHITIRSETLIGGSYFRSNYW